MFCFCRLWLPKAIFIQSKVPYSVYTIKACENHCWCDCFTHAKHKSEKLSTERQGDKKLETQAV